MKVVVAVTAASGGIYARQLLCQLIDSEQVERIALIFSTNAEAVLATEGVVLPESSKIVRYSNDDMFASVASGSQNWDAMVVVPSSVGTVARIAAGTSQSLIERAADVMLKERRRLVMVVREAPYSLIHLRNMTTLTEAGAIIVPASPSFYFRPSDIETLCLGITTRALEMLGLTMEHDQWGE